MLADSSDRKSWYARSRSRTVTGLLLAAPGIPALFMGQEFLEDKNWSDIRLVDGLISWEALDGAGSASRDFLKFVADMIRLRRSQPALRGSSARVSRARNYDRVIVLHRWIEGEGRDVVVIAISPSNRSRIMRSDCRLPGLVGTAQQRRVRQFSKCRAGRQWRAGFVAGASRWMVSRREPPLRFLRTASSSLRVQGRPRA